MQERNSHETEPRNEDIALLAHHFYVTEGSRDGHDLEHWLRAKHQLSSARSSDSRIQTGANSEKNQTDKARKVGRASTPGAGTGK